MRVALIDPSLFTLPYDAALAAGLQQAGHTVRLYARRAGPDDNALNDTPLVPSFYRIAESRLVRGLPATLRLGLKGVDHVASMAGLTGRLQRARPDVIHFQWLPLPALDLRFLPRLRRIAPLVLTVHDTNPFNGNPAAGLQRHGVESALRRFDRLIVHTEQGQARLVEQGLPRARIAVLPHGLLAAPPPPDVDPMRGELTFLLFGKIKPYKGIDLLIEAFARLPAALRMQARLRVVGKPYMELEPLRALARQRGVAERFVLEPRFVADDEIPALFAPGTIATFPYREIEASGVLALAIAHARPILATRLGGFAETIEDGKHGLLVPPEDIPALSAAMARFVAERDFTAHCARSSGSLAETIPDWAEIGRLTCAVYAAAGAAPGEEPVAAMSRPA